jgi:hypothetical protein
VSIFVLGKVSSLWVFARARVTDATHTWRNFDQKTVYFTQDKDLVIHSVASVITMSRRTSSGRSPLDVHIDIVIDDRMDT